MIWRYRIRWKRSETGFPNEEVHTNTILFADRLRELAHLGIGPAEFAVQVEKALEAVGVYEDEDLMIFREEQTA